ncbi:MAG: hypothetical protein JW894_16155 [Bacteroidales bacterium]|nr:hypothetical protein [Bacteroidales bacterium]
MECVCKIKVFVSKQNEGWSELNIPKEFRYFSYDKMVRNIHKIVERNDYKGLLITQNPEPFEEKSLFF